MVLMEKAWETTRTFPPPETSVSAAASWKKAVRRWEMTSKLLAQPEVSAIRMAAGSSGILLHEAVGHAFEADFVRKGTSIFSDRLGMQICDKSITIVDDATLDANRGSLNYDDEGIPGQRTCLVEKGRLNSFMHDRISAKYYNTAPTGNGRRESFRYMPS